jgi:hypothetical protein
MFVELTSFTEAELRTMAAGQVDAFLLPPDGTTEGRGQCVIDGRPVENLPGPHPSTPTSPYRVQAPVFDYTLPAVDNLNVIIDGACYQTPPAQAQDLTVEGAVADGLFVLIKPLPVGKHHIDFGPDLSRHYTITVTPSR